MRAIEFRGGEVIFRGNSLGFESSRPMFGPRGSDSGVATRLGETAELACRRDARLRGFRPHKRARRLVDRAARLGESDLWLDASGDALNLPARRQSDCAAAPATCIGLSPLKHPAFFVDESTAGADATTQRRGERRITGRSFDKESRIMNKKFIPNGDIDFVAMAEHFARTIANAPQRYSVSAEESSALTAEVARFRAVLTAARGGGTRSSATTATAAKEEARAIAEKRIRRIAHLVRVNESIDAATKIGLGMRERTAKPKVLTVPNEPPRLEFVRAIHDNGAVPVHELQFTAADYRKAKPDGAVRLELFCDLIAPDEPIPNFPGATPGSRPLYLRSFTRSPITLTPPMARVPMRVVYWGRWADSAGNVGPFSSTAVGWIEGGTHHLMGGARPGFDMPKMIDVSPDSLQDRAQIEHGTTVYVALLEAQQRAPGHAIVARELRSQENEPPRQLEAA